MLPLALLLLPGFCRGFTDFDTVKTTGINALEISAVVEELRIAIIDLRQAEKGNNPAATLSACQNIGNIFNRELLFAKAIEYYQRAEALAIKIEDETALLEIQTLTANSLLDDGQADKAREAFLKLLEKHEKSGDYQARVRTLQKLADASLATNNFTNASDFYLKIKTLAEKNQDWITHATALNNLGYTANQMKDYKAAVGYFSAVETGVADHRVPLPGYLFTNLGIAWNNLGEMNRSVETLRRAEASKSEEQNRSYIRHLISTIYLKNDDVYNALRYNESAIETAQKSGNAQVMCDAFNSASQIYQQLFEYDKALDFYKKHLALKDSLLRVRELKKQNLLNLHDLLEQTETELFQTLANEEVRQLTLEQLRINNERLQLKADNQGLEADRQEKELALLRRAQEVKEANLRATELEAERNRQALDLTTQQLLAEKQSREITSLNQQRQLDSLQTAQQRAEQQQQIALLESQKKLNELQLQQEEEFRKNAYLLGGLLGLILLIIFGSWLYSRRLNKRLANQNRQIEAQKQEIDSERNRAESLLLNILPGEVAQELKSNGMATPKFYQSATVLFTDFAGFTKIAAGMPPGQVVQELNECFLAFDEISERHRLEKIKTIGDSYMCAGGLPLENATHPSDAVAAAIEMLHFIEKRNRTLAAQGKAKWPIRIGIHTGELVAGVVGSKKFAYDIWGDTVNVASRMESNAEAGIINISAETYRQVKAKFACSYRGEVDVKNKGKMGMYYVETPENAA